MTELSTWSVTLTSVAYSGERFVDRVVDDLVDEVMQALRTGGPDVHGWPLADGFQPFEHLDLVGAVVAGFAESVGPSWPFGTRTRLGVHSRGRVGDIARRGGGIRRVWILKRVLRVPSRIQSGSDAHRHDHVGVIVAVGPDRLHHGLAHLVFEFQASTLSVSTAPRKSSTYCALKQIWSAGPLYSTGSISFASPNSGLLDATST